MIIFSLFIFIVSIHFIKSKQLTSENCDKVSEELSAQGVTFEERFQLNIVKANDALCLYHMYDDSVYSCCNQFTEKTLVETATTEYNQIFLDEIKTLSNTLSKIHSQFHNISVQTCLEFGVKLKLFSSLQLNSANKTQIIKGIVSRIVSTLISFLRNASSEKEMHFKINKYINQYIRILSKMKCKNTSKITSNISKKKKKRHIRHANFYQKTRMLVQEKRKFKSSDVDLNLNKSVQMITFGVNATKTILRIFNVSLDIISHISKCQKCTLTEECAINVMRMNHCSYCAGETLSRPCFSVCLQVISGCIWRLQSLSKEWKALFELTEKYFSRKRNQDRLFKGFVELYSTIRIRTTRLYEEHNRERCSYNTNVLPMFSETLKTEMRSFASYSSYEARHIKLFWENLAVTMCTRSKWFSSLSNNHHCWNGSTITSSPQWHKCSFCQDKKIRHDRVPKIMAHNIKTISSLFSDITMIVSLFPKHSQKNSKLSTMNVKNDILLKQSEISSKSTNDALKQNKSRINKSTWKDLGKSNFIIFDDADGSEGEEEGSGRFLKSDQNKLNAQSNFRNTSKPLKSRKSTRPINLLKFTTITCVYLSLGHVIMAFL